MKSAAVQVDIAAVGSDVEQGYLTAQTAEELGSRSRRGSVGAVGHNAQAVQLESGNAVDQELNVIGLKSVTIREGRKACRVGSDGVGGVMEDILFHGQLDRIGELEAVGAKEFDAIIRQGLCEAEITTPA
jgi:hypothetical protein